MTNRKSILPWQPAGCGLSTSCSAPTSRSNVVELATLAALSSPLPVDDVELDELVDVASPVLPELEVAGGAVVIEVPNEEDATALGP